MRVVGSALAADRRRRGDDSPGALFDHRRDHRPDRRRHAGEVDADDVVPHVVGHLDEWSECGDACVGDEHIDPPELPERRIDELAHVGTAAGVRFERQARSAEPFHHPHGFVELLGRAHRRGDRELPGDVTDHDPRAFSGEGDRVVAPLPLGGARDHHHLVLEAVHGIPPGPYALLRAASPLVTSSTLPVIAVPLTSRRKMAAATASTASTHSDAIRVAGGERLLERLLVGAAQQVRRELVGRRERRPEWAGAEHVDGDTCSRHLEGDRLRQPDHGPRRRRDVRHARCATSAPRLRRSQGGDRAHVRPAAVRSAEPCCRSRGG